MFGYSAVTVAIWGIATVVGVGAGLLLGREIFRDYTQVEAEVLNKLASDGETTFEPVDISMNPLDYYRAMRHLQKQRKAGKRGYVKWYRLGSNMKRPVWVKPELDGAGVPKYKTDGIPYYFEPDSMVVDERTGAYVAMHREGESDPINLRDFAYPGISGDKMDKVINLEAESKPPGFLDSLNLSNQTLLWGSMGLLFIVFAGYRYMGGGM